jgi:hypothetical protein
VAKAIALLIAWTALAFGAASAVAHGGHDHRSGIAADASLIAHGRPSGSSVVDAAAQAWSRSPSIAAAGVDDGDRAAERAGEPSIAAVPGCPGHDGAPCCCTSDRGLRTTPPRALDAASIGQALLFDVTSPTCDARRADDVTPQAPRVYSAGARGPPLTA